MFRKLRNNIGAIIFIAILGLVLMGATYVNLGPTSLIDGDIGVTSGHGYYIDNIEIVKYSKFDATSAPTVNNDIDEGYKVGSIWVDVTNNKAYVCLDNTDGAAVWTETTQGGAGISGTPEQYDYARFIDATNIEGRNYTETKEDLDVDDLENVTNAMDSSGIVTGGVVTEGTNAGTFKVTAITEAYLRASASATAPLTSVTLAEQDNQTITAADTTYFVIFTYGTPCTITLSETAPNGYNAIPLGKVMKDGSDNVHYIDGGFRFGDGVRKLHQRAKTLRALELESGSAIEYSGTNNFIMGTGIVYGGLNRFSLSAYDSSTTQFTYVYSDGGAGWTEAGSNVIDFAHYDDGDGTLGNVDNNKYSVHYVYKHIDDEDVYVVYGTGSYTLAEAEVQAIIPPTIPDHLTDFGCQIGAIIAPQAGGSFASVIMVTSQFFSGTEVVNHNNLGGLQGGTVDEYYHLTETEHTNNALTTDKLSAFAATTSAELTGVISDETGTGVAVFGTSPTFTTQITTPKIIITDNDVISLESGTAGSVDRLDFKAQTEDLGIQFFLLPNGTNTIAKIAMSNSSDTSNWGSLYLQVTGATAYIGSQDIGSPANTVTSLCIGGGPSGTPKRFTYVGINTETPSGDFDINAATDADPHILLSENDATKWDIYNDHNDDNLQVKSGSTLRYEFGTDGTAVADVAWNTFSPKITATGRDLLAVALEDANKPVKPYEGIPIVKTDDELFDMIPTEYEEEVDKLDEEGKPVLDKDGKPVKKMVTKVKDEKVYRPRKANEFATEAEKQAEFDKYAKCPAKITIANARYLEYLTGVIDTMQAKIDELEARIEKLEQKEAMK